MSDTFKYQGNELTLFQHANNWKKYFSKVILQYIKMNVLEVGAGIGATTSLLNNNTAFEWLLLEPDSTMSNILIQKIKEKTLPMNCKVLNGTIDQVNTKFDTIIYIDVLEHIKNDKQEIRKAASLLNNGGYLIILSPAFEILYSPFDHAIGHFRRYQKKDMKELAPPDLEIVFCKYFDSMGYFAALINKIFLQQKYPTEKQIKTWDSLLVPVSKFTDKLFFHRFGKSIICVWYKQ
jgi:ubiquinone/menaquinone biosynthesis C-methylase UbiE